MGSFFGAYPQPRLMRVACLQKSRRSEAFLQVDLASGSALGNFARIGVDCGGLVLNRPDLGGGVTATTSGFLRR